jgi:hypothetical protein
MSGAAFILGPPAGIAVGQARMRKFTYINLASHPEGLLSKDAYSCSPGNP